MTSMIPPVMSKKLPPLTTFPDDVPSEEPPPSVPSKMVRRVKDAVKSSVQTTEKVLIGKPVDPPPTFPTGKGKSVQKITGRRVFR